MVSQKTTEGRETDRRKLLAGLIYNCAKMVYGSVAIGGMSPLLTGDTIGTPHIACIVLCFVGGTCLAYAANYIMKFKN